MRLTSVIIYWTLAPVAVIVSEQLVDVKAKQSACFFPVNPTGPNKILILQVSRITLPSQLT